MSTSAEAAPLVVARWDLDKTYLRTEFDTLGELLRTALERPDQKRAVPGASAVLRELGKSGARVHILSGSPRQMRRALSEKLDIDGVRFQELTLKPNFGNLARLRFRALRDQLGYKLPVLLESHAADGVREGERPRREVLVGDDVEADAFIYSLYADICAGGVSEAVVRQVATAGKLYSDQAERILARARAHDDRGKVERIMIHLDRQTPPSRFDGYGQRLVPFYNYLQVALVLLEDGLLGAESVLRVASQFATRHRFDEDALARSYKDLMRRGHVSGAVLEPLERARAAAADLPIDVGRMVDRIAGYVAEPPEPVRRAPPGLDYVELAKKHQGGRNRKHPS